MQPAVALIPAASLLGGTEHVPAPHLTIDLGDCLAALREGIFSTEHPNRVLLGVQQDTHDHGHHAAEDRHGDDHLQQGEAGLLLLAC